MTNTRSTPTEALERIYPMRVLRYTLRRGSGGAGRCPGGEGIERELLMLEDVTLSLITERRHSQPWGVEGGERSGHRPTISGASGNRHVRSNGSERAKV